jgi:hypothetical protein
MQYINQLNIIQNEFQINKEKIKKWFLFNKKYRTKKSNFQNLKPKTKRSNKK